MGNSARVEATIHIERDGGDQHHDVRVAALVVKRQDQPEVVGAIEVVWSEPHAGMLDRKEEAIAEERLIEVYLREVLHEPDWPTLKAMGQSLCGGAQPGSIELAKATQALWERAAQIGWPALATIWKHAPEQLPRVVLGEEIRHAG